MADDANGLRPVAAAATAWRKLLGWVRAGDQPRRSLKNSVSWGDKAGKSEGAEGAQDRVSTQLQGGSSSPNVSVTVGLIKTQEKEENF